MTLRASDNFNRDSGTPGENWTSHVHNEIVSLETEVIDLRAKVERLRRTRPDGTLEICPSQPLKPCPFDGGTRLVIARTGRYDDDQPDDPDNYAYVVHCTTCAADGPWRKSQSGAEQMWNGIPGTPSGGPLLE